MQTVSDLKVCQWCKEYTCEKCRTLENLPRHEDVCLRNPTNMDNNENERMERIENFSMEIKEWKMRNSQDH